VSDIVSPWQTRSRLFSLSRRQQQANGLRGYWWLPVLIVKGRMVSDLLEELRRVGIPACCVRFGSSLPAVPQRWCLLVGSNSYQGAEESLGKVLSLLNRSPRYGPAAR
jgi:hypothetical protein